LDIAHSEEVEKQLDAFIERRDEERRKSEGECRTEDLWQESVRCHNARQEQDHRLAWYEYEMRLYRIHSGLASEHLARVESLENGHHEEEHNGHHSV
jgi:hypothetical protein